MGLSLEQLIASLRENERRQIEKIWQQAKAEAETIRKEAAETIDSLRKKQTKEVEATRRQCTHAILAEADTIAKNKELFVNDKLATELFETALKMLPVLRTAEYENVFLQLADELPPNDWQQVTVSEQDREIAIKKFPGATVKTDAAIYGGLMVSIEQERIIVDNTFNKRLERHWNFLLPRLIKAIEAICIHHDSTDQSA
jgi:vacuolar-type H+-ATPase subunit E/Vma4